MTPQDTLVDSMRKLTPAFSPSGTGAEAAVAFEKAPARADESLESRVDQILLELFRPENRERLERYRFHGSTNRVYRIPLGVGDEFVIVKLLPSRWVLVRKRIKKFCRSRLYGEHEVVAGHKRVQMEVDRAREWRQEGLPVPAPIDTSIPGARVFQGLHFPTFFTILEDESISLDRKLEILTCVTRSLSFQHKMAWNKGKKSLVHPDPGPWNIMYDLQHERTYWFDLEHPADYPKMSLETLMIRALRIYLYGVLDHMGGRRFQDVLRILCENYEMDFVLRGLVRKMQDSRSTLLLRIVQAVGMKKGSTRRRARIAAQLNETLMLRHKTS